MAMSNKPMSNHYKNGLAAVRRREINRRYREKLKSDPKRWAAHLEKQRQRRDDPQIREAEREAERKRYHAFPESHPRKNRKDRHTKDFYRKKRAREHEELPDHVVANRYLHLKVSECPKAVIDLKREQIRLNRELKIRPNTI